jgi:hypothetical protein
MPTPSEEDVMEDKTRFLDCPAFLGTDGAARCGLPAEVEAQYIMRSTDGPLECAKIRCPRGHWFNGPIESLTVREPSAEAAVSPSPAGTSTSVQVAAIVALAQVHAARGSQNREKDR